jgi:hypothetical protein
MTDRLVVGDRELQAVSRTSAPVRYGYFIKRVADWQTAWGLWNEGWVLMGNAAGEEFFPLWPALEYARQCVDRPGWAGAIPKPIALKALFSELLPKLASREMKVAVFPTLEGGAATC